MAADHRSIPLFVAVLLCLLPSPPVRGQRTQSQWEAANFPNPTDGDHRRCNMRSKALLCDPDAVLSESERYRVNYELGMLESSTRQDHGRDFCERKGITAAVAIMRRVRGGGIEDVRRMANDMLRRWTLDGQCQKAIMVVLSTEDRRFWVARNPAVPVYAAEFDELFKNEQATFKAGQYAQGLQNIVRAVRDRALAKQAPPPAGPDGRSKGTPFVPPAPPTDRGGRKGSSRARHEGGGGGMGAMGWLLVVLGLFVVLSLLCCCCCVYLCCCRKGQDASGRAHPEDAGGARGRGLGGLPLAGLLSGAGGAASNWFAKRRGARGGAPADPPPAYSPVPQDDKQQGRGLYPSVAVKDEGGGGSF